MRTATAALSAVALTLGLAAPALAHPASAVLPPLTVDLTHTATDNVGFVARLPEHAGSAGGALTPDGDTYVITDPRGLFTYDVTNPRSPELLGFVLINQGESGTGAALAQEDPPTDGRIVLVDGRSEAGSGMHVVSIEDPANPTILSVLSGQASHTWTCVSDVATDNGCGWAYGRGPSSTNGNGQTVDLRDPANPVLLETGWRGVIGDSNYIHDLTEVRPGLVMTAGSKPVLLDTTDPANPIELVRVDENDHAGFFPTRSFPSLGYHSVEWARGGADDFLVMGTEIAPSGATNLAGSDCAGENSVIETWDARGVREALATYETLVAEGATRADAATTVFGADRDDVNFVLVDAYDATGRGVFLDGAAPAHVLYCAHWMEVDPNWQDGGRLVIGYYNRGVRFVDVPALDADGASEMTEAGWFLGADAYTGSAQWVSDGIVYVSDYARGLDIVEITDQEATGTYTADSALANRAMTMAQLDTFGIAPAPEHGVPTGAFLAAGFGLLAAAALRRRTATVHADRD